MSDISSFPLFPSCESSPNRLARPSSLSSIWSSAGAESDPGEFMWVSSSSWSTSSFSRPSVSQKELHLCEARKLLMPSAPWSPIPEFLQDLLAKTRRVYEWEHDTNRFNEWLIGSNSTVAISPAFDFPFRSWITVWEPFNNINHQYMSENAIRASAHLEYQRTYTDFQ